MNILGFGKLWLYLNVDKYSTIIYIVRDHVLKEAVCTMSKQISIIYNKTMIFWPCPNIWVTIV